MPKKADATIWMPAFRHFITMVKVPSKETAEPQPIKLYRAQNMLLESICDALDEGIHHIVALKARQLGASTVLQLLDLFWLYMHPGLQGAFIADSGENKETFRDTFAQMLDSLPRAYKVPVSKHNRSTLIFNNNSRLQYMSAGHAKNSGLGRSRALNFVHATECSSYGDQKGLDSLQRALAEENPNRLYVFESTALGFNVFYDMYQEAKRNPAQKAVFIGWWAKDTYILREGSPEFDYWWGRYPRMTDEEQERAGLVAEKYGWDLTPEQVAWYRKQSLDKSEESLFEELPSTEDEAFQATGSPFFSRKRVTEDQNFIRNNQVMFKGYAYQLGTKFTSTVITPTNRMEDLDLRVWEEPKPNGKYVIGMDPTYGRSEEADRCVISVWRCYSDKMVQAAEFCNDATEPQQGAWVLAHLAGSYRDCVVNLEINGPGMSVMDELKYVKEQISFGQLQEPAAGLGITTALDNMRWYFYHRPDSMGAGFAYNWRTSFDNKLRLLNNFRDAYNTNIVIARSIPLLEEFTTLVQDGQTIQASGRNKDDRIFAAALAQMAWAEWIRTGMMANQQSYDRVTAAERDTTVRGDSVVSNIVSGFFKEKAEERAAAARAALERY